jgi:hypothetical protein
VKNTVFSALKYRIVLPEKERVRTGSPEPSYLAALIF